ncbi:MAG: class II fructose-bisphosphate aldolase [Actinobacteria bacterium]|nr:class II fructose-bisphosphate aldolase [Actinomycetota bacterium]
MTTGATREMVGAAFAGRYAIPAFNVFDDFSMRAVLQAAAELDSPVIIQVSVKTVRSLGAAYLRALFLARAREVSVPAALHLDHCPERAVITAALEAGFDSLLFDASDRSYDAALVETREVVEQARGFGAAVESEIEGIRGVEDGVGSEEEGGRYSVSRVGRFVAATGVDFFAPAIGTAHGRYSAAPRLSPERINALVEATGIPQVLHGGTGLAAVDFADLVGRGCAKVNVSTAIKEGYLRGGYGELRNAAEKDHWDPPRFFAAATEAATEAARTHIRMLGSAGKAA